MCGWVFVVAAIIILFAGIWAILTGKLPSWVLGGGKYKYESSGVRWLGLLLLLPLPLSLLVDRGLLFLLGEQGAGVVCLLDIVAMVAPLVAALLVALRIRRPVAEDSEDDALVDGV